MLENDCHDIDKLIALEKAKARHPPKPEDAFTSYIKTLHQLRLATEQSKKLKKELTFEEAADELPKEKKKALLSQIKEEIKRIENLCDKLTKSTKLDKRDGPVVAHLETVLNSNNITIQAFHSCSFTGNHCNKYLSVYRDITSSVSAKAQSLTMNTDIRKQATSIAKKYRTLNCLYSKVHTSVSHSRAINEDEIEEAEESIKKYILKFRKYCDVFTPKLHILEHHVIPWMEMYGYGMGLHGEQGGRIFPFDY